MIKKNVGLYYLNYLKKKMVPVEIYNSRISWLMVFNATFNVYACDIVLKGALSAKS
jgi:hypothetical protein